MRQVFPVEPVWNGWSVLYIITIWICRNVWHATNKHSAEYTYAECTCAERLLLLATP